MRLKFIFLLISILILVLPLAYISYVVNQMDFSKVKKIASFRSNSNTLIFDRYGNVISELYEKDRKSLSFEQVPQQMIKAIVAVEDRRFWSHFGVDLFSVVRAVWDLIKNRDISLAQGGSTITQQVVRHFLLSKERSFKRKIKEMAFAIKLESISTKRHILELYLNEMYLGSRSWGVSSAARRYFSKELSNCNLHEFALIAGLFKAPTRLNPFINIDGARKRQIHVLITMVRSKAISLNEARLAANLPLIYKKGHIRRNKYPYFSDYIQAETKKILGTESLRNSSLQIFTSLDPNLQILADKALSSNDKMLKNVSYKSSLINNVSTKELGLEAAILVAKSSSGEILAMKGGLDYDKSQFNRAVSAKRQVGSLFKPFVYSLALSRGYKWSDTLVTKPLLIGKSYRPRGNNNEIFKETTLLRALYKSLNLPTIQLALDLGLSDIINHAVSLGAESNLRKELGLVLGSSEMSLKELISMYAVFANGGISNKLYGIVRIKNYKGDIIYEKTPSSGQRVMDRTNSYLVTKGLASVLRRGTGVRASDLAYKAAGKSGTSNTAKDNWFVGYSPSYITGVWVGSDSALPLSDEASGSSMALPIWKNLMKKILLTYEKKQFNRPAGVASFNVDPNLGHRDSKGIKMWLKDNEKPKYINLTNKKHKYKVPQRYLFGW